MCRIRLNSFMRSMLECSVPAACGPAVLKGLICNQNLNLNHRSAMLRAFLAFARSPAAVSSCTRMLSHGTQAACTTLPFSQLPEKAHPGRCSTVNYFYNGNMIVDDVHSIFILPESSFASEPSCNLPAVDFVIITTPKLVCCCCCCCCCVFR